MCNPRTIYIKFYILKLIKTHLLTQLGISQQAAHKESSEANIVYKNYTFYVSLPNSIQSVFWYRNISESDLQAKYWKII